MAELIKQSNLNKARLDKFILAFSIPDCLKGIAARQERGDQHKSGGRVIPDDLQYSIYGAVVPEVDIPSITLPQFGQHLKVSSHRRSDYSDVTVNFNIDNEFNNYWYIFRWLDILNDQQTAVYDEDGIGTAKGLPSGEPQEGTWLPDDTLPGDNVLGHFDDQVQPTAYAHNNTLLTPDIMLDYTTKFTLFGLNEYNKEVVRFDYTNAFPTTLGEISFNYQDAGEISSSFTFSFSQLHVSLM